MLQTLCLAAAEAIKTQCGREYGVANENEKNKKNFSFTIMYWWIGKFAKKQPYNRKWFLKNWSFIELEKSRNLKFKAKAMRISMNLINRDNFDVEKMRKRLLKMKLKLQTWYFIHKLIKPIRQSDLNFLGWMG